jgi:hypothetical protein
VRIEPEFVTGDPKKRRFGETAGDRKPQIRWQVRPFVIGVTGRKMPVFENR